VYIFQIFLVRFVYFCYLLKKLNDFNIVPIWFYLLIEYLYKNIILFFFKAQTNFLKSLIILKS